MESNKQKPSGAYSQPDRGNSLNRNAEAEKCLGSIELSALLRTEFHIQGKVNLEKLKKWFGGPIGNIMLRSLEFILKEIGSH